MPPERWLPYGRQLIEEGDIEAVSEVLRNDFLTTGPKVQEFESALVEMTGAGYAKAVNSGTSALHAAYSALGLGPGDELITTPLTFAATANVAIDLGASVRFADIDPSTGNIDPEQVASLITDRTKLIVPVDFSGLPADYDRIDAAAKPAGIKVVADAAHSLGGTYMGRPVGTLADATTLSFHPVKTITTGEGGAVLSLDPRTDEGARQFRSHGMVKSREMQEREGPWFYEIWGSGLNYRITDFQCALGLSQLQRLGAFLQRRREIVNDYWSALEKFSSIRLPIEPDGYQSAWHLFVLRLAEPNASLRRRLFERLTELGLRVQVHYIPVYWHPRYRDMGFQRGLCPQSEDYYHSAISLPLFPGMSDSDVGWSIEQTTRAIQEVLE